MRALTLFRWWFLMTREPFAKLYGVPLTPWLARRVWKRL